MATDRDNPGDAGREHIGRLADDVEAAPVQTEAEWEAEQLAAGSTTYVPHGLTIRQWRFVNEFVKDFSQSAAARRAGYAPSSAGSIGHSLMRRPKVQYALGRILHYRAREYSAEHSRIFQALCAIAYADPHDFVQWGGDGRTTWTDSESIPAHQRQAVRRIKHTRREYKSGAVETVEITFEPRLQAIELLMKATGMLREQQTEENRGAFRKWLAALESGEMPIVETPQRALPHGDNGGEGHGNDDT